MREEEKEEARKGRKEANKKEEVRWRLKIVLAMTNDIFLF